MCFKTESAIYAGTCFQIAITEIFYKCFHAWLLFCDLFFMSLGDGDTCNVDMLLSKMPKDSKAQLLVIVPIGACFDDFQVYLCRSLA